MTMIHVSSIINFNFRFQKLITTFFYLRERFHFDVDYYFQFSSSVLIANYVLSCYSDFQIKKSQLFNPSAHAVKQEWKVFYKNCSIHAKTQSELQKWFQSSLNSLTILCKTHKRKSLKFSNPFRIEQFSIQQKFSPLLSSNHNITKSVTPKNEPFHKRIDIFYVLYYMSLYVALYTHYII